MPIYEYACGACGHTFEEWQKMSDPPVKTCPKCKKKKVEKLISQTAFQLKGGGWYKDLYSSSKAGSSNTSSSGDSSSSSSNEGAGGSSTTSEATNSKPAKPAAKESKKEPAKKSESRAA